MIIPNVMLLFIVISVFIAIVLIGYGLFLKKLTLNNLEEKNEQICNH